MDIPRNKKPLNIIGALLIADQSGYRFSPALPAPPGDKATH
jgi:hypothetical protein